MLLSTSLASASTAGMRWGKLYMSVMEKGKLEDAAEDEVVDDAVVEGVRRWELVWRRLPREDLCLLAAFSSFPFRFLRSISSTSFAFLLVSFMCFSV